MIKANFMHKNFFLKSNLDVLGVLSLLWVKGGWIWNWVRTESLISAFSFSGTRPEDPVPKWSKNQNWMEMFF
jgi:hypothetical protein